MTLEERFWSKVDIKDKDDCWEWHAYFDKHGGYGRFKLNGKCVASHRIAWTLTNGDIPEDLYVLHKCDNRRCTNPNHLFLGTYKDNAVDRMMKGRNGDITGDKNGKHTHPELTPRGIKSGRSKLTEEQVLDIRNRYVYKTNSSTILAKEYNVSVSQIERIAQRKFWLHLKDNK